MLNKPLDTGPISSVTVMGQTLIIINDSKLAFELMEKRSAIHSSRPKQIFAGEMLGWENSLGLSPYNNRFRTYRKNMAKIIGSKSAASQFNELQEAEAGHFLLHVLEKPENLLDHIRRSVIPPRSHDADRLHFSWQQQALTYVSTGRLGLSF
jgi:hypothetical protein